MISTSTTSEHCQLLLNEWRTNLVLSQREQVLLKGEIKNLDLQIRRLNQKHLRIAAFGRVGVGKSSLLNALLGQDIFATDVAHGCTRYTKSVAWEHSIKHLKTVEFVDTPETTSKVGQIETFANTKVSGIGTLFDADYSAGDLIKIEGANTSTDYTVSRVASVTSNTVLDVVDTLSAKVGQMHGKVDTGFINGVFRDPKAPDAFTATYYNEDFEKFVGYSKLLIKIVMTSETTAKAPVLQDYRAIAVSL